MTYEQVKRIWELYGEGEYGLNSFDNFTYSLHMEGIISFKLYLKFIKKFKKKEGYE